MLEGTIIYAIINSVVLALTAIGFNLTFGISGIANLVTALSMCLPPTAHG